MFGTSVEVMCQNATAEYSTVEARVGDSQVYVDAIGKNGGGPNITTFNRVGDAAWSFLSIASGVTIDPDSGEPTHMLAISWFGQSSAFVLECTYSGCKYLADVSVGSPVSPLIINGETSQGPILGPLVKQRIANVTDYLLENTGGNLAQGFIDAEYNPMGGVDDNTIAAIEIVIVNLVKHTFR